MVGQVAAVSTAGSTSTVPSKSNQIIRLLSDRTDGIESPTPFISKVKDIFNISKALQRLSNLYICFLIAPVGVGFSYSDTGNYECDDDRTAYENKIAIQKFFELYPELKSNKFFITG